MPKAILSAQDFDWLDLKKYQQLRTAASTTIASVVQDRKLLFKTAVFSRPLGVGSSLPLQGIVDGEIAIVSLIESPLEIIQNSPTSTIFSHEDADALIEPISSSVNEISINTVIELYQAIPHHIKGVEVEEPTPITSKNRLEKIYFEVDMRAHNKKIISDFSKQLNLARKEYAISITNRDLENRLRAWASSGAIPLIDMEIYRITRQQIEREKSHPDLTLVLPRSVVISKLFPGHNADSQLALYENAQNHQNAILKDPYLLETLRYSLLLTPK